MTEFCERLLNNQLRDELGTVGTSSNVKCNIMQPAAGVSGELGYPSNELLINS